MDKKTVRDEQLAEEIKKLLEQSDVDDTVITEVVAKINEGDDVVDADGNVVENVDLDSDEEAAEPEKVQDEEDVVEEEDEEVKLEPEEDNDNEVDLDDENAEEADEEAGEAEDADEAEEEAEVVNAEEGDLDNEDVEEATDEEPAEAADPYAKLKDPVFADAFNRGYAFAVGLMKMGKLPEMGATDEAEEVEEEVEEPAAEPVAPEKEEEEAEQRVVAQDSIDEIKASLAKEIAAQFNAKLQAKDKVKTLVGEIRDVMAFDSANDIYKFALEQSGVNIGKYEPSAYEGMIDMMIEKRANVDIPVTVKDSNPFEGCGTNLNQAIARLKKINSK